MNPQVDVLDLGFLVSIKCYTYTLEVWSDGVDFVDEIFHGLDANVANISFDDGIVGKCDTLAVNFTMAALVDQFADGLEVGVSPGNVWLFRGSANWTSSVK